MERTPFARLGAIFSGLALATLFVPPAANASPPVDEPNYPPIPAGWTASGLSQAGLPAHEPVAAKVADLPTTPVTSVANEPVSLGNDKYQCTYSNANWWSYAWDGAPASWERSGSGRFDHFGAQDLRSTGWVGGTERAEYTAEIGQGLVFNGNDWVRARVEFPWSYRGDVSLLSQWSNVPGAGGFSSGTINMRFLVDLMRDDVRAEAEVDEFTLTANRGVPGEFEDISNSGFATRTVGITGYGEELRSAFRVNATLETETQSMTNARSSFYFAPGDGRGWKSGATQRWIITVKPGRILIDCG